MTKDENFPEIKELVQRVLPGSRVILFGSRSRGDFDKYSDYDILVVSDRNLNTREKRRFAGKIRKKMAVKGIPADVMVKTEADVHYYGDKLGSVVREAVRDGIE